MLTMVLIGAAGLMLTMFMMRANLRRSRRNRDDGIRWRGIDWSRGQPDDEQQADDE
ncbi:MAG TPA: hypothetical protein VGH28_13125 [Polyangiaceae bacterium]|jgi:hypothetical protein